MRGVLSNVKAQQSKIKKVHLLCCSPMAALHLNIKTAKTSPTNKAAEETKLISKIFNKRGSYASPDNCEAVNYEESRNSQLNMVKDPVIIKLTNEQPMSKCSSTASKSRGAALCPMQTCDKRAKRITELGDSLMDDTFLGKKSNKKWGNVKFTYCFSNRKASAPKITAVQVEKLDEWD
jgi:hypothetical protein